MKIEERTFDVAIPTLDGNEVAEFITINIPMEWDEEIGVWLMTEEGTKAVEDTKARYMGLLLPKELRALRDRLKLTQGEIGELLQIGEKTWTRWETGKGRPSRSVNLLLRALHDRELSVEFLRRSRQPRHLWKKVVPFNSPPKPISMDSLYDNQDQLSLETERQQVS